MAQVTKSLTTERNRMKKILSILRKEYPDAQCSLTYETPYQLLIATILSAQCTDERVNKVTPELFKRFPTPEKMAKAKLGEIEKLIQSTGFFRNKALSILHASQAIVEKHQGQVPQTLDELTALRGVGRKTANVVLGNAYGIPGLVVDTHVGRLCRRMGFTRANDPEKVEAEMMEIVPKNDWTVFSHYLILHGREVCAARRAECQACKIAPFCARVGVTS